MSGPLFYDRVKETTSTTGTGTYTLAGAVTGFQAFSTIGDGNTCYYTATDGTNWEVGYGTYTLSGTTLARTRILASSNSGSAVSWSAGAKTIWLDAPAAPVFTHSFPTGYLSGVLLSNSGSNSIVFGTGSARDSADVFNLVLGSSLTKDVTASWAVGSGNGGLDTGVVGNSIYYCYLIMRPDTGVVDAIFSLSSSAPTLPTNYTAYAKVGKFARVSAANTAPRGYSREADIAAETWVAYTPGNTNGLGTCTGVTFFSRRNGPDLEVKGKLTAGTTTASELRISFGFNGTDANVSSDSTVIPSIRNIGGFDRGTNVTDNFMVLVESGVTYITVASQVAGGLTKQNGSAIISTGNTIALWFSVPIQGW